MVSQNVANYKEPGGARDVVRGSLDIASGGEVDFESGSTLKIAGTTITISASRINRGVSSTGAGIAVTGGEVVVTGTLSFSTGLSTVNVVVVSQNTDPITSGGMWVQARKATTAGWVIVNSFKPTAANDVNPVYGTAATTTDWVAVGSE